MSDPPAPPAASPSTGCNLRLVALLFTLCLPLVTVRADVQTTAVHVQRWDYAAFRFDGWMIHDQPDGDLYSWSVGGTVVAAHTQDDLVMKLSGKPGSSVTAWAGDQGWELVTVESDVNPTAITYHFKRPKS